MMQPEDVRKMLLEALPGAEITVEDQTGTLDHFQIIAVSKVFEGKTLIEQHQMIQKPLKAAIEDGRIHAIAIKTMRPITKPGV